MTLLDDIIDAATNSSIPATDLLRKVQVVAHRLGAAEVVQWVKQELAGYPQSADLPEYRVMNTNVLGTFAGPMRSFIQQPLISRPNDLAKYWTVELRQPLLELQGLAEGENDPTLSWPPNAVGRYEASGVYRIEMHDLFSAEQVITRQSLRGVIDIVRSKALEFALELQAQFPEAGAVGGPTVESEPALAAAVYYITNNITGDGTNVATGSHITQRSKIQKGDTEGLKRELSALGISASDAQEFVAALQAESNVDAPRTRGFIDKVRAGAITVAGSLSSDVVAGTLVELGKAFLGLG
ncbi:AbiTii domain-containing protein [Agromyces sp. ZXT2-3]|uniref:AbiTii domain-containing protein n=1 Tax=Agromyces sp. ZXT2-3 TaxID=3461152 RepID=UPI00405504C1